MVKDNLSLSLRRIGKRILLYLLFFFLAIIIFFPFYWIIITSLKSQTTIYSSDIRLFPQKITLENYFYAISESNVLRFSLNSVFVGVISTILTVIISVMAVYPLVRMEFKGKRIFYALLASTQVFPLVITILPLYMFFRKLNLYNSHTSLILLYTAIGLPISIVLLMGNFKDVPIELENAAFIDGCSKLRCLTQIVLPVAKPSIASTAIYIFLSNWQEYLAASSLIADVNKYTLTLGLTLFRTVHSTNWGALMATSVLLAVPAVILFFAIEDYFIDSFAGAVKE